MSFPTAERAVRVFTGGESPPLRQNFCLREDQVALLKAGEIVFYRISAAELSRCESASEAPVVAQYTRLSNRSYSHSFLTNGVTSYLMHRFS